MSSRPGPGAGVTPSRRPGPLTPSPIPRDNQLWLAKPALGDQHLRRREETMPKGKGYGGKYGGTRAGQKAMGGYPGRGAASMANKSTSAGSRSMGSSGTLKGGNSQVKVKNEMRADTTSGIEHANAYPMGMGGGHGPGRS